MIKQTVHVVWRFFFHQSFKLKTPRKVHNVYHTTTLVRARSKCLGHRDVIIYHCILCVGISYAWTGYLVLDLKSFHHIHQCHTFIFSTFSSRHNSFRKTYQVDSICNPPTSDQSFINYHKNSNLSSTLFPVIYIKQVINDLMSMPGIRDYHLND